MKIKYIILCFIILISTYAQEKSEMKSINNDYKKIEKNLKNKIPIQHFIKVKNERKAFKLKVCAHCCVI